MMKTKRLLLATLLLSFFFGCTKREDLSVDLDQIVDHQIDEEQAIRIAMLQSGLSQPYKTSAKRGGQKIAAVQIPFKSPKKIAKTFKVNYSQTAPSYYIINYEGGGFTIVSGDEWKYKVGRVRSIIEVNWNG